MFNAYHGPGTRSVIFLPPWASGWSVSLLQDPQIRPPRAQVLGRAPYEFWLFDCFSGTRLANYSLRLSHWLILIMLVQLPKVHKALMKVLVSIYLFFRPKISTFAQLPSLPFSMQRACMPLRLILHLLLCEDKDKLLHGVLLFRLLFSIRTSNKNAFKMLMKLMKARSWKQLRLLTVSGRFVLHFNYRWARTKTLIRIAPDFGSTSLSFAVWTSFQCLIRFPFYFSFWFYSRCFNVFILFLWKTGLSDGHETCCHKSRWDCRGIIW